MSEATEPILWIPLPVRADIGHRDRAVILQALNKFHYGSEELPPVEDKSATFTKDHQNAHHQALMSHVFELEFGIMPDGRKILRLKHEARKLRDAIRKAGFSVMETSGEWSIHGVREHDRRMESEDLATVVWAAELQIENERFRRDVDALLNGTIRTAGEARSRLVETLRQPAPERRAPRPEQPT